MRAALLAALMWALPAPADVYAVVVGVEAYRHPELTAVPYAAADAEAVRRALTSPGVAAVPAERLELLVAAPGGDSSDSAPTRAAVMLALKRLGLKAGAGDLLIFYFAGHGIETPEGQFLLTADSDPLLLEETSLSLETLRGVLEETRAGTVLLCLDSCRNDPYASRGVGDNPLTDGFARGLRPMLTDAAGQPRKVATLLACDVGQRAWAWPELGGGAFTRSLTDGLRGAAAGRDGTVSLLELAAYVSQQTADQAALRGRQQRPLFENPDGVDWALARPSPAATLRITSEPSGAEVSLNGRRSGRTPCTIELELRDEVRTTVEIAAALRGYRPATSHAELLRGETTEVVLKLAPARSPALPSPSTGGPGFLGASLRDVTDANADERRRWPWLASLDSGVLVISTVPGGPADGILLAGQAILGCDGEPTPTARLLLEMIRARRAGDTVRLLVRDGTGARAVHLQLGAAPPTAGRPAGSP